jgi:hypothetical protein
MKVKPLYLLFALLLLNSCMQKTPKVSSLVNE